MLFFFWFVSRWGGQIHDACNRVLQDLLVHPCIAAASAQAVRSLGRCIPKKPSNLYIASQQLKTTFPHRNAAATQPISQSLYLTWHIPNTEDMTPKHGFVSGRFGRRTRNFGRGGRGRCVADWTAELCGFGTMMASVCSWARNRGETSVVACEDDCDAV